MGGKVKKGMANGKKFALIAKTGKFKQLFPYVQLNKKARLSRMLNLESSKKELETQEIEFKGKSKDGNEWVYGSLLIINNKHYIYSCNHGGLGDIDYEFGFVEVMPATVSQYTGSKDKSNQKIYKGDILQGKKNRRFIVTWNNDIGGWVNRPIDNDASYPCFNIGTLTKLEKVGNIHDNPELLNS